MPMRKLLVALSASLMLATLDGAAAAAAGRNQAAAKSASPSGAALRRPFRPGQVPLGDGPLFSSPFYHQFLDKPHYESIRDAALEILRRYPPNEYLYVGIGRAPTSIVSFIKELNPKLAINFPASGLGTQGGADIQNHQAAYDRHFSALIGDAAKNKKILVFDRSWQGSSIHRFAGALRTWAGTVQSKGVVGLGLFKSSSWARARNAHADVEVMDASPYPKLFLWGDGFAGDHDEDIGEYGSHHVHEEPLESLAGKRNPLHAPFREQLARRMQQDQVLDQALTTELSQHLAK
jgi:hypothetical protein